MGSKFEINKVIKLENYVNSTYYIVGNWTCFSFLKTFHLMHEAFSVLNGT